MVHAFKNPVYILDYKKIKIVYQSRTQNTYGS